MTIGVGTDGKPVYSTTSSADLAKFYEEDLARPEARKTRAIENTIDSLISKSENDTFTSRNLEQQIFATYDPNRFGRNDDPKKIKPEITKQDVRKYLEAQQQSGHLIPIALEVLKPTSSQFWNFSHAANISLTYQASKPTNEKPPSLLETAETLIPDEYNDEEKHWITTEFKLEQGLTPSREDLIRANSLIINGWRNTEGFLEQHEKRLEAESPARRQAYIEKTPLTDPTVLLNLYKQNYYDESTYYPRHVLYSSGGNPLSVSGGRDQPSILRFHDGIEYTNDYLGRLIADRLAFEHKDDPVPPSAEENTANANAIYGAISDAFYNDLYGDRSASISNPDRHAERASQAAEALSQYRLFQSLEKEKTELIHNGNNGYFRSKRLGKISEEQRTIRSNLDYLARRALHIKRAEPDESDFTSIQQTEQTYADYLNQAQKILKGEAA